jgi:hypothetical protein
MKKIFTSFKASSHKISRVFFIYFLPSKVEKLFLTVTCGIIFQMHLLDDLVLNRKFITFHQMDKNEAQKPTVNNMKDL